MREENERGERREERKERLQGDHKPGESEEG
jgi:hypothetical protein